MTNLQASELFNILSGLNPKKGTHQELAVAKTLRNMRAWSIKHLENMEDIRDNHAATKDVNGAKVILKEKVNVTKRDQNGNETVTEELVPMYTQDGLNNMKAAIRNYLNQDVSPEFAVYSTSDDSGLSAYQKELLKEYGFLLTQEDFDSSKKINSYAETNKNNT